MDGDNGYRLDTTEEIVSPQAWAEELAEIAPTAGRRGRPRGVRPAQGDQRLDCAEL